MLNLSPSSIEKDVLDQRYISFEMLGHKHAGRRLRLGMLAVFVVCCGLAWIGLIWFGLIWFGLIWFGLVWLGLD